ncbi:MAG: peptidoglycan DD-metalloendopeptidase family protein [Coriobacteriia bacterium]|nr:peptidoglycan DD-metalloendopeptidase family protein [Coriobacteriia bacterium]
MRHRRAFLSLIAFSLIAAIASTPLAHAYTRADLEAHEKAASDAREAAEKAEERAKALAGQIETLEDRMAEIESAIAGLADDIAKATERTRRLNDEVADLRRQVAVKESEIASVQAEYDAQTALLAQRLQEAYKQGDLFFVQFLLDAQSIEDLIARTSLVERVIRDNQRTAAILEDTQRRLEAARTELARTLEAVDLKRKEAAAEEKRLRNLRAQHRSRLAEQEALKRQKADLMAKNKADAERLRKLAEEEEEESRRIAAELFGHGSGYFAGVMAWPVPGFYRVSSPFGYRIHPILGVRKLHTGIDIGRDLDPPRSIDGATIVSAGAGTVIYAGYRGGYGNTIIIDHGNGVATLYAHQRSGSFRVGVGEHVGKGEPIGAVGSTGLSTGPHLHFEVRINGTPTDPMPYLR